MLVAMGIHNWVTFQIVVAAIMGACSLVWLLLPESPR